MLNLRKNTKLTLKLLCAMEMELKKFEYYS